MKFSRVFRSKSTKDSWGGVNNSWEAHGDVILCHGAMRRIFRGLTMKVKRIKVIVTDLDPKDRSWRKFRSFGYGVEHLTHNGDHYHTLLGGAEDLLSEKIGFNHYNKIIWVKTEILEKNND